MENDKKRLRVGNMSELIFTMVLESAFVDLWSVGRCEKTCRGMKVWALGFWEGECKKMVDSKLIHAGDGTEEAVRALTADARRLVRLHYVLKKRAELLLLRTQSSPETPCEERLTSECYGPFDGAAYYDFLAHFECEGTKYAQLIPAGGGHYNRLGGLLLNVSIPEWRSLFQGLLDDALAVSFDLHNTRYCRHQRALKCRAGLCIVSCRKRGHLGPEVWDQHDDPPTAVAVFTPATASYVAYYTQSGVALDLYLYVNNRIGTKISSHLFMILFARKAQRETHDMSRMNDRSRFGMYKECRCCHPPPEEGGGG